MSRGRRLAQPRAAAIVARWREYLEIQQHVRTERVSRFQVTDADTGRPGAALIGVVHDCRSATIYHTRALTVEDIVHELLHVAYPAWSEAAVVRETERLTGRGRRVVPPAASRGLLRAA